MTTKEKEKIEEEKKKSKSLDDKIKTGDFKGLKKNILDNSPVDSCFLKNLFKKFIRIYPFYKHYRYLNIIYFSNGSLLVYKDYHILAGEYQDYYYIGNNSKKNNYGFYYPINNFLKKFYLDKTIKEIDLIFMLNFFFNDMLFYNIHSFEAMDEINFHKYSFKKKIKKKIIFSFDGDFYRD